MLIDSEVRENLNRLVVRTSDSGTRSDPDRASPDPGYDATGRIKAGNKKAAGMTRYEDLPYRACVGMMLINKDGLAFIGRRTGGIEHVDDAHVWQMPQGGVDPGEDTWAAAKRELMEETNVHSVEKLAEIPEWLTYDIPRTIAGRAWKGRYRGQKQKWYAMRFTGKDDEINVVSPAGHKQEFVAWRWEPIRNLPDLIVPFKRPVYERVVKEFARFG